MPPTPPAAVPAAVPVAVLDTVIARLAPLFLAAAQGNETAARHTAAQMVADYHPETQAELHLAAQIISFGFHALEALSQAMTPEMPLTRILRLRGSAVSLSRESHKAQRRLDQLRQARRAGTADEPAALTATQQPNRRIEKALDLIADTRDLIESAARDGGQTWTQAYQQRQRARRMTENLRKNQAAHLNGAIAAASPA